MRILPTSKIQHARLDKPGARHPCWPSTPQLTTINFYFILLTPQRGAFDFIMLIKLLTKVFGSRNDRTLRRMRKVVNIINAMEPEMEKLSDEELKGKTAEFRARKKAKCWKI